jgi:hypothetical protein
MCSAVEKEVGDGRSEKNSMEANERRGKCMCREAPARHAMQQGHDQAEQLLSMPF